MFKRAVNSQSLLHRLQKRQFTDRSFRLATVQDLYVAHNFEERLHTAHYGTFKYSADLKPRDTSKQIVIDLSHEQGYRRGHIPNAINLPVEKFDFTRQVDVFGGITIDDAVRAMKNCGVCDETSEIILYDNSGLLACRLWFVLRYFGFRRIRILHGGWRSWLKSGLPVSEETPEIKEGGKLTLKPKRTNILTKPSQMIVDFENKTSKLLDARNPDAFNTYHIERALNIPSRDFMEDSRFATVKEIRERCESSNLDLGSDRVIVYSSKSLTSSVAFFALQMAGCDHVSLYDAGVENWRNCFDDRLTQDARDFMSH